VIEIRTKIARPDTEKRFDVIIQVPENGDIYREVAVSVFPEGDKCPIADVLVTIDIRKAEPMVYLSAEGNADTHPIVVRPMALPEEAVKIEES